MYRLMTSVAVVAAAIAICPTTGSAQSAHHDVTLHVNPRWDECAFQLDASLTQQAWRQFTKEAALVTYFRPLRDAKPMGARNFEISIVQSTVGIDDTDAAWNDTFVHPDSTHWLYEGSGLPIPGLVARAGVTDRIDVGAYYTQNPNSNYGFVGGQVQYNFMQQGQTGVDASARGSVVALFGPEDLDFTAYGVDLVASRQLRVRSDWASLAPYVGVSGYLANSHEQAAAVSLEDERSLGVHAMFGAVAQLSLLRVAVEYDAGAVASRTVKIGFAF